MRINTLITVMVFTGFVLGIGATLITQYVNKHITIEVNFDHYHDLH